jgi:elongation factor Ts
MSISANVIKDLREKTQAGMMDCKKALMETNGDFEAAVDWLRKKGLAAASKKAGRIAAEGLVALGVEGNQGTVIEINSETDFVAKNDKFQALCGTLLKAASAFKGTVEDFKDSQINGTKVSDIINEHIAVIGENINLRRFVKLSVPKGAVVGYIHNQTAPGLGKIGVLVALESEAPTAKLQELGRQLAMHIAAINPQALEASELDTALVAKEKAVLQERAAASGKPAQVIEKMVEGGLKKFFKDVVLMEQTFCIDGKTEIREVVTNAAKDAGSPIKLSGYIRYALGEGIEKKEENLADEVAKIMHG